MLKNQILTFRKTRKRAFFRYFCLIMLSHDFEMRAYSQDIVYELNDNFSFST